MKHGGYSNHNRTNLSNKKSYLRGCKVEVQDQTVEEQAPKSNHKQVHGTELKHLLKYYYDFSICNPIRFIAQCPNFSEDV